jgi:transcriptional regulator with XRE-family HTH domain
VSKNGNIFLLAHGFLRCSHLWFFIFFVSGLEEMGRRSTWNILVVKIPGFAYEKENAMATVPYRLESQEDLDDQDSGYPDPLAVADTPYSDVARAEAEQATIDDSSELNIPNRRRLNIGKKRSRRKSLHKISDVRQRQGVTLRNVARRLGIEMAVIRKQEKPDSDLRISDLLRWQLVLDVPLAELLEDGEDQLSGPILVRSRMVKLMKTAAAIREQVGNNAGSQLVSQLIGQILEMMPELADITPWHTVGQRRTLDDVGRTARDTVPDDLFGR